MIRRRAGSYAHRTPGSGADRVPAGGTSGTGLGVRTQVAMIFEDFPGWQAARAPRAIGPRPEPEALRSAYLELLKLCLCDLGGTSTASVGKTDDGGVMSRELSGEELRVRAAGMDWPLHGLTMIGLNRLDDLQSCVESVVREDVEGDLIEAGVWRGGASILMRATLDSLGSDERTVCVADSFQGFPMPADQEHLNVVHFLAVPLEEVKANFGRFGIERGVRFIPGFFEDTMSGLSEGRWSIVRLDGDTYEATWRTLQSLYPGLSAGGYLIVDDYGALEECRRAVDEFRSHHGVTEPLEKVDWTCVRWRRESEAQIEKVEIPGARRQVNGSGPVEAVTRPPGARVPTERELELTREIARLRQRSEAAQAEIDQLHASLLAGPKAWLRRKLRAGGSE
jgi:O-methyltransferase